jgi:hypothetical protein
MAAARCSSCGYSKSDDFISGVNCYNEGMAFQPLNYIGAAVAVEYKTVAGRQKHPEQPVAFEWDGQTYRVTEVLQQWVDFRRRGRFANNMQPQHAEVASHRGSWGVGRFHFYVRTESGQIFQLYYDRAPKDIDNRLGAWVLVGEYQLEAG